MTHFLFTRMLIFILIKIFKAEPAFYNLFKALFSYTPLLIKNVGIIPVTIVIWNIYYFLIKELKFKKIPLEILNKLNPVVINNILSIISNDWDTCINNVPIFKKLFRIFLIILFISLIKKIIWNIIKIFLVIIISSIIITLNENLFNIILLKTVLNYILYYIPIMPTFYIFLDYFNWVQTQMNLPLNNSNIKEYTDNDLALIISITGLIFTIMVAIIKIGL